MPAKKKAAPSPVAAPVAGPSRQPAKRDVTKPPTERLGDLQDWHAEGKALALKCAEGMEGKLAHYKEYPDGRIRVRTHYLAETVWIKR